MLSGRADHQLLTIFPRCVLGPISSCCRRSKRQLTAMKWPEHQEWDLRLARSTLDEKHWSSSNYAWTYRPSGVPPALILVLMFRFLFWFPSSFHLTDAFSMFHHSRYYALQLTKHTPPLDELRATHLKSCSCGSDICYPPGGCAEACELVLALGFLHGPRLC